MESIASKRFASAAAVALGAGALLAVGVAAHTSSHDSALSLNAYTTGVSNNYFWGAVTSPSSKCVGGRRVFVFRRQPGDDAKLGSDVSLGPPAGAGSYTVTAPAKGDLQQGTYYSEVRRYDRKPGPRHDHICRGAKSEPVPVGP